MSRSFLLNIVGTIALAAFAQPALPAQAADAAISASAEQVDYLLAVPAPDPLGDSMGLSQDQLFDLMVEIGDARAMSHLTFAAPASPLATCHHLGVGHIAC